MRRLGEKVILKISVSKDFCHRLTTMNCLAALPENTFPVIRVSTRALPPNLIFLPPRHDKKNKNKKKKHHVCYSPFALCIFFSVKWSNNVVIFPQNSQQSDIKIKCFTFFRENITNNSVRLDVTHFVKCAGRESRARAFNDSVSAE